jgi:hypothetical protein
MWFLLLGVLLLFACGDDAVDCTFPEFRRNDAGVPIEDTVELPEECFE